MAEFEIHCQDCIKALGKPFTEVHKWLDAFCKGDYAHRDIRHHLEGIEAVRSKFGDEAAKAAKIHICRDWKIIENEIPSEKDAKMFRLIKRRADKLGHNNPYPKD